MDENFLPIVRELGSLGVLGLFLLYVLPRFLESFRREISGVRSELRHLRSQLTRLGPPGQKPKTKRGKG